MVWNKLLNIYFKFLLNHGACLCCSWTSWRTGMPSVWRCSTNPRRRSESSAIKTLLLPACEGTSPTASTPWWEKHAQVLCSSNEEEAPETQIHKTCLNLLVCLRVCVCAGFFGGWDRGHHEERTECRGGVYLSGPKVGNLHWTTEKSKSNEKDCCVTETKETTINPT